MQCITVLDAGAVAAAPAKRLTRRRFVVGAGGALVAAAGPRLLNPAIAKGAVPWSSPVFTLGVASGDPTPDGVVLWTRLAPDPLAGGGMPDQPVEVRYEVVTPRGAPG